MPGFASIRVYSRWLSPAASLASRGAATTKANRSAVRPSPPARSHTACSAAFLRALPRCYGYRKVAADIREEGENRCCAETVRRIMRETVLAPREDTSLW
ncbi:MAG: transposase [Planctomycetes bacterium]|nr:transposase [Planctomycetota bacterium]